MILDDLKDRLGEQWQNLYNRLQESSIYISIAEKFNNLSVNGQRAVLTGTVMVLTLAILAVPLSYINTANSNLEEFENRKSMIRELFRIRRASQEFQDAPPPTDPTQLVGRAQGQLQAAHILAEQIKSVQEYDNSKATSNGIPKAVIQKGIAVSLQKLNLRQVVDLGVTLQNLERGLRMVGLQVEATDQDPHYFNAEYKLVSFSLPIEPVEKTKSAGKKGKK